MFGENVDELERFKPLKFVLQEYRGSFKEDTELISDE